MIEQERPFKDRLWEFTKDISIKVSKKAEKHWKINTLRVEIASIKHRINVKYKELGRYVYESYKADTLLHSSFQEGSHEIYDELQKLEADIVDRENRIELLEVEMPSPPAESSAEQETEQDLDDEFYEAQGYKFDEQAAAATAPVVLPAIPQTVLPVIDVRAAEIEETTDAAEAAIETQNDTSEDPDVALPTSGSKNEG